MKTGHCLCYCYFHLSTLSSHACILTAELGQSCFDKQSQHERCPQYRNSPGAAIEKHNNKDKDITEGLTRGDTESIINMLHIS